MPLQTFAELEPTLKAIVDLGETLRVDGEGASPNLVEKFDALQATLDKSDFQSEIKATQDLFRGRLSTALQSDMGSLIQSHLFDWARFLNLVGSGNTEILDAIEDHFIDFPRTVSSRVMTNGAITPVGGPTGDHVYRRLDGDRHGNQIESRWAETKSLKIIEDQNDNRDVGLELVRIDGARFIDPVEFLIGNGSGARTDFALRHPSTSTLLQNPSWDAPGGPITAPTSIPGWDTPVVLIGDGTDFEFDEAVFYLPARNPNVTPRSLEVKISTTLTQLLANRRVNVNFNLPYFLRMAYKVDTAPVGTGTIEIRMGTTIFSKLFTGDIGWNVLELDLSTLILQALMWPENWTTNATAIEVDITLTAGTIHVDDLWFGPWIPARGHWFLGFPGQTPAIRDDEHAVTDTAGDLTSKIQRWWFRTTGRHLPHVPDPGSSVKDPV